MRAKQLDPAVWVIVALAGVAVFSALMALATRSCVQAMKEGFESASTGVSSRENGQWASESVELEPEEYASFKEKVQSIDLGIGVHLGTDMEQVKAVLGAADTAGRAKGGYEYTYLFFASAGGPSPKQRHRGGFFAVVNSATLTVTATDEKVAGITFFASPLSSGDAARWAFLTLDGKPLASSKRILIQAGTEDHPYGFRTQPARSGKHGEMRKITELGGYPLNVRKIEGRVTFKRSAPARAVILDGNGYPTGKRAKVKKSRGRLTVQLPADSLYTVLR